MDTARNQPTNHRPGPLISFSYRFLGLAVLTLPAQTSALASQYAFKINRRSKHTRLESGKVESKSMPAKSWLGRNQVLLLILKSASN